MIKMPRTLNQKECTQVVRLYEQMLECHNRNRGEQLADAIDEIIEIADQASFDAINKVLHQTNLPLMMKHRRITSDRVCHQIDRSQIGSYSHQAHHSAHSLKG
ncbi:TPA: hypothetical protein DCR79_01335 [Patescibacteria group bacterium]|nr:hypothetical protein [Patescibacteria group bacterium]